MNWPDQCGVVIPCLNEAAAIGEVVARTRSYFSTILVIDDGSVDATAARASGSGAKVLRHPSPRGKGAALVTGLRWLWQKGFSWALTMDGDGQHSAADIPKFLDAARQSDATLLVGDRMHDPSRMPWLRRNVNQWLSRRLSRLTGRRLPDSQCGFRLFHLGMWATLEVQTSHFETESEMLLAFIAAGQKVAFIPIEVIYKSEQSKIQPVRDTWRWFVWWWEARRRFVRASNGLGGSK